MYMEDVVLAFFVGFILGWIIGRVHLKVNEIWLEKKPEWLKKRKKKEELKEL